ncbi:MAG: serine--tRNA ligase [Planctomycetota bacterium]
MLSIMLDLDFIRNNPDAVKKAVRDKNEKSDVDAILKIDAERRQVITELDNLRHQRNQTSEEIARLKKEKKDADKLIQSMKSVGERIKIMEKQLEEIDKPLREQLYWIPNVPASDVPVGGAAANVEVRQWGQPPAFNFTPQSHWLLGQQLKILDLERATKISGGGFMILKGAGAALERALINFMLDVHTGQHSRKVGIALPLKDSLFNDGISQPRKVGISLIPNDSLFNKGIPQHYQEINLPYLVNQKSMFATGQLPKLADDMYQTAEQSWLIPTGEVPLTNIFRDEILDSDTLPRYYVTATPCFRREAGSHGKETRGINRVHQFNKVELVKFVHPDTSFDELEKLVTNAESILQALGLHYRVIKLSTGEMSFASAKTYDLEAWAPGLGRYLEVSSCGNFTDFQARRANIKFRDPAQAGQVKFVHTLNGSGLALPRTLICLLETYQQSDGSIVIPEILRPYLNGQELIKS